MKRDDSLLYIPLETEIFPNSKLLNDLRNENLSNSDMDEKSLLSVRISHDDTSDKENGLLYQMNQVSKRQLNKNNNVNMMESMLNSTSNRNKKEIIVSELNIKMNSTEKKKKKIKTIIKTLNLNSVIQKKIFNFTKKIKLNDSISKTNRSINQMTPKLNVSWKTKPLYTKQSSYNNSPLKHINCHTSIFESSKKPVMNLPLYKLTSYQDKFHFPCIVNYTQCATERSTSNNNKRKLNLKKIHINNKIHNINNLLFQAKAWNRSIIAK